MMKFILLSLLISGPLYSKTIKKCGVYRAEGYYTRIKSVLHNLQMKDVIILNRGSDSEIIFYIHNKNLKKLIPKSHLGVNFKLELSFISQCHYRCEGKIKKVIGPIDPFQEPKQFTYPIPTPLKGTGINCKKSSLP